MRALLQQFQLQVNGGGASGPAATLAASASDLEIAAHLDHLDLQLSNLEATLRSADGQARGFLAASCTTTTTTGAWDGSEEGERGTSGAHVVTAPGAADGAPVGHDAVAARAAQGGGLTGAAAGHHLGAIPEDEGESSGGSAAVSDAAQQGAAEMSGSAALGSGSDGGAARH